jgi:hypothetical protein
MGFQPGATDNDDGGNGFTNAGDKSGLVGHCEFSNDVAAPGGSGVFGFTKAGKAAGVFGASLHPTTGVGVQGNGPEVGVSGFSKIGVGLRGFSEAPDQSAVFGMNTGSGQVPDGLNRPAGAGVWGHTKVEKGTGVVGSVEPGLKEAAGVTGIGPIAGRFFGNVSASGGGVDQNTIFGFNGATGSVPAGLNRPAGAGVWGHTKVEKGTGVVGSVEPGLTQAAGVTGIGPVAGQFFGDVKVTGDVQLVGGDCAEDFDVTESAAVTPGTVMVINGEGNLQPSEQAYDKRVAGVISGAGGYRPGLVLDKQTSERTRKPLALVGKVYCLVDAQYASVEVGDLLTSSPTFGHAMKATDPHSAFGAVIGKALGGLKVGRGLIPILIALQ